MRFPILDITVADNNTDSIPIFASTSNPFNRRGSRTPGRVSFMQFRLMADVAKDHPGILANTLCTGRDGFSVDSIHHGAIWRYSKCQMATHAPTLRIQKILGGEQALGQRISNEQDLIRMVRSGLPHAALESVMGLLGLSADAVSAPLSLAKRTLSRRKGQARLTAGESDRLLRLARVAAAAVDLFGDPRKASAWLQKPNRALGNATPLSQMDTDIGVRQVERVLGRIEHGVFS